MNKTFVKIRLNFNSPQNFLQNEASYEYILKHSPKDHFPGTPVGQIWGYRGISTVLNRPPKFFLGEP